MEKSGWNEKIKTITDQIGMVSGILESYVSSKLHSGLGEKLRDKITGDELLSKWTGVFDVFTNEVAKKALGQPVKVKIKKLAHFKGELPSYQTKGASGLDVRAQLTQPITIQPGQRFLVPTGLSVEIPTGFEIQVRPRSGAAIKQGITLLNTPGTIDSDYRGEVMAILVNLGQEPVTIKDQERIAQWVVCPVMSCEWQEVEDVTTTDRGEGGFGSTGAQ